VFWIELNSAAAQESGSGAVAATALPEAQLRSGVKLRTVVCVEDNPADLMLIERLIARRPDIRLLSAKNGSRGIEIAPNAQVDAILMDINLPGISGIEALQILSDDPAPATRT